MYPCVRREIPEQCVTEQVILTRTLASAGSAENRRPQLLAAGAIETASGPESIRAQHVDPRPASTSCTATPPAQAPPSHDLDNNKKPPDKPKAFEPLSPFANEPSSALDSLVWGSHQSVTTPALSSGSSFLDGAISPTQEQLIIDFHWKHVSWMHNVLHMPSFINDYQSVRHKGSLPHAAWLSCYYAVLASAIGLAEDSSGLARGFYKLTLETIQATDTMTPCIQSIQAICIVMPCAHAFGDNKRIITLLSSAISIAQTMGLHQLDPDSCTTKKLPAELIHREICKRIWCFLTIQDAYLITFKRAYIIHPQHVTTPEPANCIDDSQSQMIDFEKGRVIDHPMSLLTRNSFTILLRRVMDIQRSLHDAFCSISTRSSDRSSLDPGPSESRQGFEKTMAADEKLSSLTRALPAWLTPKHHDPTKDPKTAPSHAPANANNNTSTNIVTEEMEDMEPTQSCPYHSTMTRTLRIALLHLRIKTNRPFYMKGLTSRLFYFSAAACLNSARSILRIYLHTADQIENEVTTTQAHVITACIIVMLRLVQRGSRGGSSTSKDHGPSCDLLGGDDAEVARVVQEDRRLIVTALDTLRGRLVDSPNLIAERGVRLVSRVLGLGRSQGHGGLEFGQDEVERLAVVVNGGNGGDGDTYGRTSGGGGDSVEEAGGAWSTGDGARIPIPQVDDLEVNQYLDQWLEMFDCDPGFGLQL
ncbi:fungal specific transcription factor domain-containing protein [Aspergillus stella-maris]|uniref:fungal specific transcription factor domain-containing protein n=1 Tax=Aspergillus stella-maris TaxID=1810926 RepID=UPI003CCE3CD3